MGQVYQSSLKLWEGWSSRAKLFTVLQDCDFPKQHFMNVWQSYPEPCAIFTHWSLFLFQCNERVAFLDN